MAKIHPSQQATRQPLTHLDAMKLHLESAYLTADTLRTIKAEIEAKLAVARHREEVLTPLGKAELAAQEVRFLRLQVSDLSRALQRAEGHRA